jgi:carbamoyltransferase
VEEIFPRLRNVAFTEGQALLASHFPEYKGMAKQEARRCADLAYAVQKTFEVLRVSNLQRMVAERHQNLVITGGSALNLNCNTAVFGSVCPNLYIPPCCDDTGIAVGQNAVAISKLLRVRPRAALPYLCLGENARNFSITKALYADRFSWESDPASAAKRLARDELALCHIGRPETGPRALGHRSFLMSAASDQNRQVVSEGVKSREWYRPVAPIVLEEDADDFFADGPRKSAYMLFSYRVTNRGRSLIPAVVHVDGTARIQTIGAQDEPYLYALLREYKRLSGAGVLINTSLNLKGQPIAQFLWDTVQMARKIHSSSFIIEPGGDHDGRMTQPSLGPM